MIIVVLCLLTRLLLTLGSPAPIAVHLQARKLGDHDNPFIIEYNCEGCEEVCNANCMSILCFDGPNPVQEDANKISDEHRAQSHFRIFKRTQKFREDHGVRVSDEVLARTGNSAEENNNARTRQGGKMEMMTPVHATPNSRECSLHKTSFAPDLGVLILLSARHTCGRKDEKPKCPEW